MREVGAELGTEPRTEHGGGSHGSHDL
jgi:hypothetical protein